MKLLKRYLTILAYVSLALPMVHYTGFTSSYVFSQVAFLHLIALASCIPLLGLWYFDRSSRPSKDIVLVIPALFLVSLLLSATFGVNPLKSVIGTWERFGSVLDWIVVLWYGLLLLSVFKSKPDWLRFLKVVSIVATGEAVYALAQLAPFPIVFSSGTRVFGTIGSPAFLAGYLVVTIGITFSLRLDAERIWKRFYEISIVLQFLALLLTQTRAAMLAPIVAITGCAMLIARYRKDLIRPLLRTFAILLLSSVLIAGAIQIGQRIDISHLTQSLFTGETSQSRILVWKAAFQGFLDRPFVGAGEENFIIAFQRHYDPRLYRGQEDSTWFDRSHNEFLDRLTLGGIVGFCVYICMLLFLPYILIRRSREAHGSSVSTLVLVPWIMGYAAYLFFFFHSIADTMLWITCLAYLMNGRGSEVAHEVKNKDNAALSFLCLLASVGLVGLYICFPLRANVAARAGMRAPNVEAAISSYRKAWNLDVRARRQIISDLFDRIAYRVDDPALVSKHITQLQEWTESITRFYPFELQYHRPLIFAYRNRENESSYISYAIDLAGVGILLSPTHPEPYMLQGVVKLDLAALTTDQALQTKERREARADFAEAHRLSSDSHDTNILYLGFKESDDSSFEEMRRYIHEHADALKLSDWILATQVGSYTRSRDVLEYLKGELANPAYNSIARYTTARKFVDRAIDNL